MTGTKKNKFLKRYDFLLKSLGGMWLVCWGGGFVAGLGAVIFDNAPLWYIIGFPAAFSVIALGYNVAYIIFYLARLDGFYEGVKKSG